MLPTCRIACLFYTNGRLIKHLGRDVCNTKQILSSAHQMYSVSF